MLSRGGGRARPTPGGGTEVFSWYFFRISGLALIFLAIGHVVIMHVVNTVDEIDYEFVANRWNSPFWRVYDMMLLFLALLHGVNGARVGIDDYVRRPGWRVFAFSALWLITLSFLVIGAMAILQFDPEAHNVVTAGS
jgi:succinate dehydrogenase / fumarate reductase, membrane anchor subunit